MPSASPGTARADPRSAHRVLMGEALTCCATPELLAALAPQPGERLLDVGCGAGAATFRAAVLAGRDGAVVGVDVSPAVLRLARERAARAGAGAVRFHAGDMQTARVAGGPFDAAMSQFGSMFFDDPVAAFANIRNHLRPGGRLGLSCWLRAGANPWSYAALIADLTREAAAPGSRPGPFSLASAPAVATLLGRAGFDAVAVTPRHGHVEVDPDAVVDDAELLLMGVPPDRIDEALARVIRHLSAFRTAPRILRLPIAYLVVTARNGNRAGTEPAGHLAAGPPRPEPETRTLRSERAVREREKAQVSEGARGRSDRTLHRRAAGPSTAHEGFKRSDPRAAGLTQQVSTPFRL